MAWNRNVPDPLENKRRSLAERERHLAEQMARLKDALQQSGVPDPADLRPTEPPVWRMEEDHLPHRTVDPTPARNRNLGSQRRRDMIWFFIFLIVLVAVLSIGIWVAYVHITAPNNGA